MLNINISRPVVHEKEIFKGFRYIKLYTTMIPECVAICDPRDFICINLNLLALRMLHAKYQYIQANGS